MCLVPLNTLIKGHPGTTKDVQSTPNSQVHLALAAHVYLLQILQMTSTTSIGDGYRAPLGQFGHQVLINTLLQALHISRMNQELGTVRFQE